MAYTCKTCASEFILKRASAPTPKYCSRTCSGIASRGRVASEETREKQRKALTGRTCPATSGDKHWGWKGGISTTNETIRAGAPIKNWRVAVFTRDAYTCQHCHAIGGSLHAHHLQPFAQFPSLRTEVSNGVTLCDDCHGKVHGFVFSRHALNRCPDCKKKIKLTAKRCRPCQKINTLANRPTCPDCGGGVKSFHRRCRSCAAKLRILAPTYALFGRTPLAFSANL